MAQEETVTSQSTSVDHPWQVVVYDDPVNLMDYVTWVFVKVFGYSKARAEQHMMEVHNEGRSVVWHGERERAELYAQQLQGFQLQASMEKADA